MGRETFPDFTNWENRDAGGRFWCIYHVQLAAFGSRVISLNTELKGALFRFLYLEMSLPTSFRAAIGLFLCFSKASKDSLIVVFVCFMHDHFLAWRSSGLVLAGCDPCRENFLRHI